MSGEVAVKQNSSTKAMSGCQDIPESESKVELNELNLIYDHEQQGLIYDNGTIVVSNGPLPEIKKDSRASSHGLAILVHIDEFRACLFQAFWELRVRTSRCPGCRPSNSCLGKPEPVGQQLWICPLLPCLQRHTFHIIIFILIFDIGKPSQLSNNAKFSWQRQSQAPFTVDQD